MSYKKADCEYLRIKAREKFDQVRSWWIDVGRWTLPHRTRWLMGIQEGKRLNNHIVDPTHLLALRSAVAGFLEGNTSASRAWYRQGNADPSLYNDPMNKRWYEEFTRRTLNVFARSNFYHAAGQHYYDNFTFHTAVYFIEELKDGLFFHVLTPGESFVINDHYGVANILVREFALDIKSLVSMYGVLKSNGQIDWSNFSANVRKLYEQGSYTHKVNVVQIVEPNKDFDPSKPVAGENRQWISKSYELGTTSGNYYTFAQPADAVGPVQNEEEKYLRISYSKRKPFIVSKSDSSTNFEYGEKGPTLDSLGLIKSLNKKAIGKDIALDHMLKPPVQGPANLRKSYITTAPNSFVPLDLQSADKGGLKPIFQINPAIAAITQDVQDMRDQVEKMYYADYLLYLTRNPKTRTATETDAVVKEQQLIIGPILQSLNWTHNEPLVDFVSDWVIENDPNLSVPPKALQGQFIKTDFISIFAQAQKAADLPNVNQYLQTMMQVAQLNPKAWDKINLDKLADIYEDRLYLPEGLNNPQSKVEALRQQAQVMQQRQQMLEQTLPAVAQAAKNLGQTPQQGGQQ